MRPESLDRILGVVAKLGYDLPALPVKFSDGMRLQRVTKVDEGDSLTLDLIVVDENLEPVWASRSAVATKTGQIWVVSREALIRMKLAAGRAQDIADVERLRELDR